MDLREVGSLSNISQRKLRYNEIALIKKYLPVKSMFFSLVFINFKIFRGVLRLGDEFR